MLDNMWRKAMRMGDSDKSGGLSLFEWLRLQRVYKPTFNHCGEVLADDFYRNGASSPASGPFPILPRACESYAGALNESLALCQQSQFAWLFCELQQHGGGWTLVYESTGLLQTSPAALSVDSLADKEFATNTVPTRIFSASQSSFTAGGKLDDTSMLPLCDGQYMILQPGRPALFCAFVNISQYADDVSTLKQCSFRYDDNPQGWLTYPIVEADPNTAHGFSPG